MLAVRTVREAFAPRAAAQDAMEDARKQDLLPDSLHRVLGAAMWDGTLHAQIASSLFLDAALAQV